MTENESIINGLLFLKSKLYNGIFKEKLSCIDEAIKALEELQQYRAIQKMIGIPLEVFAKLCAEKVPEECKNPQKAIILTDEDVDKWEAYKKIGTIEEFKNLKEKSVAKKSEWKYYRKENIATCKHCSYEHYLGTYHQYATNYCPKCGSKMTYTPFDRHVK